MTKYSRLGASSRLRSLQYFPFIFEEGIDITHSQLYDDNYLENLYMGGRRSFLSIACHYMQRVKEIRNLKQADLIWIEKEAFPYVPYWIEKGLMPCGVPYVVDYDDAIFHNYDLSRHRLIKQLLGRKIDKLMANASVVICGNDYLAERAKKAGSRWIEQVPTVVDLSRYRDVQKHENWTKVRPVIGWIGSPSTQKYVLGLKPVLEAMHRQHDIHLVLVGAQPQVAKQFGTVPVEVITWSEEVEVEAIGRFDIGIMPLPNGPWERGKCGYKLIQYMACGKPVVASPVGVNIEIVNDWKCGELADSLTQWEESLGGLLEDPSRCQLLGRRGRLAVEQHYSLQVQASRLAQILRDALGK